MPFEKLIRNEEKVLQFVKSSLSTDSSKLLTYFNQHCFNIYFSDKSYRHLIGSHFFLYLDGFGIYLALKFFRYENIQKFNASDLNNIIFSELIKRNIKVFIIGGKFSDNLISNIAREKKLNICGYHNGYFEQTETGELIENINNSEAKVIIVGLGVPKQEILASKISNSVNLNLILCVGNFLEFYFATKKRIPKKFRNKGIEWIYRLLSEPKRLWKRYLIGIPLFLFRVLRLRLSKY